MDLILVGLALATVIWLYFHSNPMQHSRAFMLRRFINWFPLGMSYAFLYMGRYNLSVSKNAMGSMMTKADFGIIFGIGTFVYGLSFLLNGPLVDKFGGKKGIVLATLGSSLANMLMGLVTYLYITGALSSNIVVIYSTLYSLNMFFQSYGAVSIIKVKAYWFHVRERGLFGAIFGTLISMGVYFAFDWGQAIVEAAKVQQQGQLTPFQTAFKWLFAVDTGTHDAIWLVFFIPAVLLVFWALIDMFLIKDSPSETGFEDFDTADASSGEMEQDFTVGQLLKKIFTNPVMLTIAAVEFTSGVLRNGTQQWYFIFAKEVPQPGAEIFMKHWGLFLCITGIMGGFASGAMSDKIFHSRRGPPAAIMSGLMLTCLILMAIFLLDAPVVVGACVLVIAFAVIGVHSIMSGTAAADFGGRKATATASGITDGFVYLGSGIQSVCLGFLTTKDWEFWPVFLAPFALLGLVLALRMWRELPAATRKYLETVEKIDIRISSKKTVIKTTSSLSLTDG